jgi:hypothetical protein
MNRGVAGFNLNDNKFSRDAFQLSLEQNRFVKPIKKNLFKEVARGLAVMPTFREGFYAGSKTTPGAPTDLRATVGSDNKISLVWTAPTNLGGDTRLHYTVTLCNDVSCKNNEKYNHIPVAFYKTAVLPPGTYTIRLTASNTEKTSNEVSTSVTIQGTPPPENSSGGLPGMTPQVITPPLPPSQITFAPRPITEQAAQQEHARKKVTMQEEANKKALAEEAKAKRVVEELIVAQKQVERVLDARIMKAQDDVKQLEIRKKEGMKQAVVTLVAAEQLAIKKSVERKAFTKRIEEESIAGLPLPVDVQKTQEAKKKEAQKEEEQAKRVVVELKIAQKEAEQTATANVAKAQEVVAQIEQTKKEATRIAAEQLDKAKQHVTQKSMERQATAKSLIIVQEQQKKAAFGWPFLIK